MRRRGFLALSAAAFAGCSRMPSPDEARASPPGSPPASGDATTNATTNAITTQEPCATDIEIAERPAKPTDLVAGSERVVRSVEPAVARRYFEPTGYFHCWLHDVTVSDGEEGVVVTARVDVDFASSGDAPQATTVHAHLFYPVTYRVTERRVVRSRAEQGPTGTVVCW